MQTISLLSPLSLVAGCSVDKDEPSHSLPNDHIYSGEVCLHHMSPSPSLSIHAPAISGRSDITWLSHDVTCSSSGDLCAAGRLYSVVLAGDHHPTYPCFCWRNLAWARQEQLHWHGLVHTYHQPPLNGTVLICSNHYSWPVGEGRSCRWLRLKTMQQTVISGTLPQEPSTTRFDTTATDTPQLLVEWHDYDRVPPLLH